MEGSSVFSGALALTSLTSLRTRRRRKLAAPGLSTVKGLLLGTPPAKELLGPHELYARLWPSRVPLSFKLRFHVKSLQTGNGGSAGEVISSRVYRQE